jgi:galactokinase
MIAFGTEERRRAGRSSGSPRSVADRVTAFAPGRINLIGEHTDYNEGLALPCAIEQGVIVAAARIGGDRIEVIAADLDQRDSFELKHPPRIEGWRAFVRGLVVELRRAGVELTAARLRITGSVPRGAGLSSSAALEVATALALIAVADGTEPDLTDLAKLCSRVENDWVGAQTGLLDQLASLHGQADHALRIDFRSLEVRPIPLELAELRLVTLDSGEQHANAASGYNERRAECAEACRILGVDSLRAATLDQLRRLPDRLARRARHVITSNDRVEEAVQALQRHDHQQLGKLLDACHASLRDDYEVSTGAVEAAVTRLKDAGALGARVIGGGFGGHVLGLLRAGARVPDGAVSVRPGAGARILTPEA